MVGIRVNFTVHNYEIIARFEVQNGYDVHQQSSGTQSYPGHKLVK